MNSGDPGAQELAQRVSVTLIEQIDNLSSIASAFSSFAKMPQANNELLNLKLLTEGVIELFKNEEVAAQFDFYSEMDRVPVFADKNQLISVLNNLIKNALQAVPDERNAKITIRIKDDKDSWLLAVKDNGSGIPDDLHSKVFVPNFTTKGSGSGLGLAIARRVIDQAEGDLWFETETDLGTTFFVRLPKAHDA
jgi:signal transduction histidine kinase